MLFFSFLAVLVVASSATTYEGYQVLKVWPSTEEHQKYLAEVAEADVGVSLWTEIRSLGHPVDVMISPKAGRLVTEKMNRMKLENSVMIEDVQKLHDENMKANEMAQRVKIAVRGINHSYYRTLDQINNELDKLANTYGTMSTYTVDRTYEGRPFKIMKVSTGGAKPAIWIDCGIHAREWIAPATCLYILDQLSDSSDVESVNLLRNYDFHILTNANPDGYEFTWTNDRMWRKNRQPNTGSRCVGTDANRNFGDHFGGVGSSDSPCSESYHGPRAFSAAEAKAIRDAMAALGNEIRMAFTIHSYSQLWMTPYGYTHTKPSNYNQEMRVSQAGVNAIRAVHGKVFEYGDIADTIYPASGGSTDYFYDMLNIKYPFALELRDKGLYGFELPPNQIQPTGEETWAGIKAAINAM